MRSRRGSGIGQAIPVRFVVVVPATQPFIGLGKEFLLLDPLGVTVAEQHVVAAPMSGLGGFLDAGTAGPGGSLDGVA